MEISGYPNYENVCSNILKFYLNPYNEHGFGDLVIRAIAHQANKDFSFQFGKESIRVHREYSTSKGNRIDLLIVTDNWVLGIENKIFHHLNNNLKDYKETIDSFQVHNRRAIRLVLSLIELKGHEQEIAKNNSFVCVSYNEVFSYIKKHIGIMINGTNSRYCDHFYDFMITLENLIQKTMEDQDLLAFFGKNSETIEELKTKYDSYQSTVLNKAEELNNSLPKRAYAPLAKEQNFYKDYGRKPPIAVFYYSYTIKSIYEIGLDTVIQMKGWSIEIFGRNPESSDFLLKKMCQDKRFLPPPYESYVVDSRLRLIYKSFNPEVEISEVKKVLIELLRIIENYDNGE